MNAVEIGPASERLRLSAEPDDPALDYLVADLSVDGLSATKSVYAHYASGWRELADFFAGLATDWRGWSGTREWTSLESDLRSRPATSTATSNFTSRCKMRCRVGATTAGGRLPTSRLSPESS